MPWWGWIIVMLICLAILIFAAVYVIRHAIRAVRSLGPISQAITDTFDRMTVDQPQETPDSPIFTHSLAYAKDQYSEAQAVLVDRKRLSRRRHSATWKRWDQR